MMGNSFLSLSRNGYFCRWTVQSGDLMGMDGERHSVQEYFIFSKYMTEVLVLFLLNKFRENGESYCSKLQ